MPNPFPGVDPYLEGPMWSTVHSSLIEQIAWQLSPQVRPKYRVMTNQRVVMTRPDPIELAPSPTRFPDVGVYESGRAGAGNDPDSEVLVAPLTFRALMPEAVTQTFLEIQTTDSQTLVTAIELLSPTNKRGDGLKDFRKKRQELLAGPEHYLEIDLLRIGERFPVLQVLPSVAYFVFLSRADRRPRTEVWPIAVEQPLPKVPVPLLRGDLDVTLDLQSAWNAIYEHYGYDDPANHVGLPVVPLSPEQQAWADECLQKASLRT